MNGSMKFRLIAVALVVAALCWSVPAKADTISIGLQEMGFNGDAIVTVAGPTAGNAAISNFTYGTFDLNNVSGTGNPPLPGTALLDTNSLNVSDSGTGTLNVFITSQGNAGPALGTFLSSFTSNALSAGWTVQMLTFVSSTNALYGGTPVGGQMFTAIGTSSQLGAAAAGADYSVTTEYIITANGAGSANSTIDVSTPEPSAFLLLGAGLFGFGLLVRRKQVSTEQ